MDDLQIIATTAESHYLDLRATKVAKAVYQHYEQTGYGNADMAIACRYYTQPSKNTKTRRNKNVGVTRESSWAWGDVYEGGGTVS